VNRSPLGPAVLIVVAFAIVLFVLLIAAERGGSDPGGAVAHVGRAARCPDARQGLTWYRRHYERWRWRVGMRPTPRPADRVAYSSCRTTRQAAALWRARARGARSQFLRWFDATYRKWACVHSREGAWDAATGNGYYGGLQMDWDFQRAYGLSYVRRWGHAGRWPVWAQLVAAERAYQSRGWHPWPNTARDCGLL
jgi:hypothetical protein